MTHLPADSAYRHPIASGSELHHEYGPGVHILSDPWALSILARLGHPDTHAPMFHLMLEACYRRLLHAASQHLATAEVITPTRMGDLVPGAAFQGTTVDPHQRVVVVDVARGGMVPSYVFQRELLLFLHPNSVRVDHVYMQRLADDDGRVIRVETSGSKIGGPVHDAVVFIPDPMGATGSSIADALELYSSLEGGPPKALITAHLMITPEYIRKVKGEFPNAIIYALRLDRGMSDPSVLATTPGARVTEERGLNDIDYIVPGAGGLGELINNAFV